MSPSLLVFWPLVALVIASAGAAALSRNLVYAALSLGVCLAGVAGLYLFLQAEYLAVIQMIVYVGGILILILFGVMFSRDLVGARTRAGLGPKILGAMVFAVVLVAALRTAWISVRRGALALGPEPLSVVRSDPHQWPGSIATDAPIHLGSLLMGDWLAPFLVIAVLLTVVLVAALGLVRKETP